MPSAQNLSRLNPAGLFDPSPYGFCHSLTAPADGEWLFISGQSGGEGLEHRLSNDFRSQVQVALGNLDTVLAAHGLTFASLLKITVLIVDHDADKLAIWGQELGRYCTPQTLPASTLIPVPCLALAGMQIEVDAIAFKARA